MKLLIIAFIFVCSFSQARELITESNHCYLDEDVNVNSMDDLKRCLAKQVIKRGKAPYPIYLILNSPGGSVYEGLKFIEFAQGLRGIETITMFSASMASAIVQALPGKRHVTDHGIMMFHRAKGQFSGQFGEGEVEQQLKLWKSIVLRMEKVNSKRIGITLRDYQVRVKDEWWIYGVDNLKQKTADNIQSFNCSSALMAKYITKKETTMFGTFEYKVSACPFMN